MKAPISGRFDWYEATVDVADDDHVHVSLALALSGTLEPTKGRNGYSRGWNITRGNEEVLVTVHVGGRTAGEVHVTITGTSCDEVVPIFRELFEDHRVSRADVAIDVQAEFESVDAHALAFARERGIRHRLVTDSEGGATRYLGSPSSEVQVRVYKKSEQLRALGRGNLADVPDGIVRYELQARPGKRAVKEAASNLSPDDFWGMSRWSLAYVGEALDVAAERVQTHFRRPSDWARIKRTLEVQYGPAVRRRAADVGEDAAVREMLAVFGLSPAVLAP